MELPFYYKTNCRDLNRYAHLCCPLSYRFACIMGKVLPVIWKKKSLPVKEKTVLEKYEIYVKKITSKIDQVHQQIDWKQNIHEASYVVFDTETTGLQPFRGDRIIALGGVLIENGHVSSEKFFDELINPLKNIPPAISKLTGINNTLISGKPTILQVLPDFLDFIGNKVLVAHSAAFDLAFLNVELSRATPLRIINPVIDTHILAPGLLPELTTGYSLESLAKYFAIEIKGRHTALGDSMATAQIFLGLLEILKKRNINTLEQLAEYIKLTFEKTSAIY